MSVDETLMCSFQVIIGVNIFLKITPPSIPLEKHPLYLNICVKSNKTRGKNCRLILNVFIFPQENQNDMGNS